MINFENLTTEKSILGALSPYTVPLKNFQKFPQVKDWQNRKWDEFSATEKKDITGRGINCGLAGIVVIDLDIDKKSGEEVGRKNWEATCQQLGIDPYATFTAKSPSGGYHLYYAYDHTQDTENPIGQAPRLGKGINIDIRGKGGLIVAPGSKTEAGTYRVLNALPIAPLPKVIASALKGIFKAPLVIQQESEEKIEREVKKPEVIKEQAKRVSSGEVSNDTDGLKKWQLITLDQKKNQLASTGEGDRDTTLYAYSYHAGGDGIPVDRVVAELLPVAEGIFTKEDDPTPAELEAKIRRGAENGRNDRYDPNYTPEWAIEFEKKVEKQAAAAEEKKDVRELTKTYTLANDFLEFLDGTYKYVSEQKEWLAFDEKSGLWLMDVSDDPDVAAVNLETILTDWLDARENSLKKEYGSVPVLTEPHRVNNVLSQLTPRLKYRVSIFDQQKSLFKADRSVIDLAGDEYSQTVRAPRADDYFTKGSNVPFDPNTDTTYFDDFMSMFPKENRDYLKLVLGQAMTGYQPSDPQVYFLVGNGANGKSTFKEIFSRVLGGYMVAPNKKMLLSSQSQDHHKMKLMGARCAYFDELPARDYLDIQTIKEFSGSGEMTSSRKYENEITFKPFATIFINTNHLPRVRETEEGAWRRLVVIDFPYVFKKSPNPAVPNERQADPRFNQNLVEDLPDDHPLFKAALLWLLEGANEWFKSGMENPEMPEDYRKASQRWQNANDRIGDWWDETIEVGDEDEYVLVADLYESYKQLARVNGQEPGNKELFIEDLGRHRYMRENRLTVRKGRIAQLRQSMWFDPEKSWKESYRPRTPSKSSTPEHIRGVRFIGTAAPDYIDDFLVDDNEDVEDLMFDANDDLTF